MRLWESCFIDFIQLKPNFQYINQNQNSNPSNLHQQNYSSPNPNPSNKNSYKSEPSINPIPKTLNNPKMELVKPIKVLSINSKSRMKRIESRTAEKFEDSLSNNYRSYIETFKSNNKKNNYSYSLGSKIAEVKSFNKIQLKDKTLRLMKKKHLKHDQINESEAKIQETKNKEEQERKKLEQDKIEEIIRKELLKKQSLNEWMIQNAKIFEEKKKNIQKEIEESKRLQNEKLDKSHKLNLQRYEEIRKTREEAKRLSFNILQVDLQKEAFVKELELRDKSESLEDRVLVSAAERIKERLRNSIVAKEIEACFNPLND